MHSYLFPQLQLITVFISRFLYEQKHKVKIQGSKLYLGFPIFDSASFLLKFIFLFNKKHYDF